MKTIKQNVMTAIILIISFLWYGCEDDQVQSRVEVETFKVEVLNDTVPSEVHVITKTKVFGKVDIKITHIGAYTALEDGEQRNISQITTVSDQERINTDTLSIFYFEEGQYEIKFESLGQKYQDSFTLYGKN